MKRAYDALKIDWHWSLAAMAHLMIIAGIIWAGLLNNSFPPVLFVLCTFVGGGLVLIVGQLTLVCQRFARRQSAQSVSHLLWARVVGIVVSSAGFAGIVLLPWFVSPPPPHGNSCLRRVKNLSLAQAMYAADYDERFAPADGWMVKVKPYTRNARIFTCPSTELTASYAMNERMGSVMGPSLTEARDTVVVFETHCPIGSVGGLPQLASTLHSGASTFGFADGHARSVPLEAVSKLVWRPVTSQNIR